MYIQTHIHPLIIYIHIHRYSDTLLQVSRYLHVCIYICICLHLAKYMYMYIYIYLFIHIPWILRKTMPSTSGWRCKAGWGRFRRAGDWTNPVPTAAVSLNSYQYDIEVDSRYILLQLCYYSRLLPQKVQVLKYFDIRSQKPWQVWCLGPSTSISG